MTARTWHLEAAFVAVVLVATAAATGGSTIAWLSAAASLLSFCHASVADRMAERQRAMPAPSVACHRWLDRYWLLKESAWLAVFILTDAWPAVVAAVLMALYPGWRRLYRRWRPMERT